MRKAIIFLSLLFYLLGGGTLVYAASQNNQITGALPSEVSISKEVKVVQSFPYTILITSATFDLEEELSSNEDIKTSKPSISYGNDFAMQVWYSRFSCQSLVNYSNKKIKIFAPFCGQSNPIYITQQVLRI